MTSDLVVAATVIALRATPGEPMVWYPGTAVPRGYHHGNSQARCGVHRLTHGIVRVARATQAEVDDICRIVRVWISIGIGGPLYAGDDG